jgi:hypothetical protein
LTEQLRIFAVCWTDLKRWRVTPAVRPPDDPRFGLDQPFFWTREEAEQACRVLREQSFNAAIDRSTEEAARRAWAERELTVQEYLLPALTRAAAAAATVLKAGESFPLF